MRKYIFLISFIVLGHFQLLAQNLGFHPIEIVTQKKGVSIRGLSIPNQQTIWASGSGGNIAKSEDGGNTFIWSQVKGYEKRDFRSIHAWNKKEAIIVAVAAPAVILKTKDGGANWVKVYENTDTSMFLDAIDFINPKKGYVIGDPINGHFYFLQTKNKIHSLNVHYLLTMQNSYIFTFNSNIIHKIWHLFYYFIYDLQIGS